jgi:DNA-directed RNA polymerase specialized sigma24 family protein
MVQVVELMTRYSNNPTLLDDLRYAREAAQSSDEDDDPELGGQRRANGRRWAVARRLAGDDLQAVVDGYRTGAAARELAERFEISESSVKRLLRRVGCRRRSAPPD